MSDNQTIDGGTFAIVFALGVLAVSFWSAATFEPRTTGITATEAIARCQQITALQVGADFTPIDARAMPIDGGFSVELYDRDGGAQRCPELR